MRPRERVGRTIEVFAARVPGWRVWLDERRWVARSSDRNRTHDQGAPSARWAKGGGRREPAESDTQFELATVIGRRTSGRDGWDSSSQTEVIEDGIRAVRHGGQVTKG